MNFNIFQFAKELGLKLTPEQEKAIMITNKNIAVVAVPGSGKTAVFVLRLAKLIKENGIKAENIMALTFSKASANDMEKRFDKWCSSIISEKPSFSTIHSFAYSIVKEYDDKFSPRNIIEGENDGNRKNEMLRRIYLTINKEYPTDDILKNTIGKIGYCKNCMISADGLLEDANDIPNFKKIYKEYELQKKIKSLYDFDDLLEKAFNILRTNNEAKRFYQNKYKYIQIDEFQDTSKIQNAIIKQIFNDNTNLFVVGDDDQSIYKFRGASPEDFLNFKNEYPNSEVLFMTKNFRSTKMIVNASNSFVQLNNACRYQKTVQSTRKNGTEIKLEACEDDMEQVNFVVNAIKTKKFLGTIAILYRNNVSAIPFIDAFMKNDITFSCYGTGEFFNNWVVRDILAFLKLANNPFDTEAFKIIYMKHFISKEVATYVCENKDTTKDVFDKLIDCAEKFYGRDADEKKEMFRRLSFQYSLIKEKQPVYKAIEYIETEFKYLEYLDKKGASNSLSVSILKQNLSVIKSIAKGCKTEPEFLEHIQKIAKFTSENEENKVENPQVYMKTIHSSKGLEWDSVFLVDLINDIFPSVTSISKIADDNNYSEIYEERRLFYVGMTRAKNNLFLCYPKQNSDGKNTIPSLFIRELIDTMQNGYSTALDNIVETKQSKKKRNTPKKNKSLSISDKTSFPTPAITNANSTSSIIKKNEKALFIDLHKGDAVIHKNPVLGKGTIIALNTDENFIKISFNGTIKAYSIDHCIKFNLLSKE